MPRKNDVVIRAEARALHLEEPLEATGGKSGFHAFSDALAHLQKHARKRDVVRVEGVLTLGPDLRIPVTVTDRGRTLSLDLPTGRRHYAMSLDGAQRAVADWIREVEKGDSAALDLFEELLLRS